MPEFTDSAAGTPCWVDVMTPELDRTVSFYSDLFGWEAAQDPRPEAGGYTMFSKDGKQVAAAMPPQARSATRAAPWSWSRWTCSTPAGCWLRRIRPAPPSASR